MPDSVQLAQSPRQRSGMNRHLGIGIAPGGIAIAARTGWWQYQYQLLADAALTQADAQPDTGDAPTLVQQLGNRLQQALTASESAKLPVHLTLANSLVRYFMVAPPKNVSSMQDCQAAATMRFNHLYGDPASDWCLMANWDVSQPFLACAMPKPLLRMIEQVCQTQKLSLQSLVPHFIRSWNRYRTMLGDNQWFGLVDGDKLLLAAIAGGQLHAVRSIALPAQAWQEGSDLPAQLAREALRLNLDAPQSLLWCGNVAGNVAKHTLGSLECRRLDAGATPVMPEAATSHPLTLATLGVL